MDYFVLKQGRTDGPYTLGDLAALMASGRFAPEDLGQEDGAKLWTPLRKLLESASRDYRDDAPRDSRPAAIPPPPLSPGRSGDFQSDAKSAAQTVWEVVRQMFRVYPLESGLVFFGLGCVVLLLSYVPVFLFAPVLLGALIGGGIAMLRGKVLGGLGLCAAAIFVPVAISMFVHWVGSLIQHAS